MRQQAMLDDDQKRNALAKTIGVTPDRLVTLSGKTCSRLNNALCSYPSTTRDGGLNWSSLLRTPNIGVRSAAELCDALGIPKTFETHLQSTGETFAGAPKVAETIVNLLTSNPRTADHFKLMGAVGSPSFVVVDAKGQHFRVTTSRLK